MIGQFDLFSGEIIAPKNKTKKPKFIANSVETERFTYSIDGRSFNVTNKKTGGVKTHVIRGHIGAEPLKTLLLTLKRATLKKYSVRSLLMQFMSADQIDAEYQCALEKIG